jgi:hypothetical protein
LAPLDEIRYRRVATAASSSGPTFFMLPWWGSEGVHLR